jgi:hypothetical protein
VQRDLTLVFGGDGTGKTQYVIRQIIPRHSRVLILDAGFDDYPATSFNSLDDLWRVLGDMKAYQSARPFRVAYTPTPDEYDLMFLLARDLGNCLIVAEEADRFNPMGPWETEYVYRGRHWGVSMVGLTIQPFGIPKDWRRILKELISFRQVEPSDIEYTAALIGEKAYDLPNLPGPGGQAKPPYPFIRWTPTEGATVHGHLLHTDSPRNPPPLQSPKPEPEPEPVLSGPECNTEASGGD